jgi:uncharacterized protein (TIGR00369 family)
MEERMAEFGKGGDFASTLGFRMTQWAEGRAELQVDLTANLLNMSGFVHGGVLMTLLDAVGGRACSWSPAAPRFLSTLSFSVNFLRGCKAGTLRAVGTRQPGGTRIFTSRCEVFDAEGELLALGQGVYRLRTTSAPNLQGEPA